MIAAILKRVVHSNIYVSAVLGSLCLATYFIESQLTFKWYVPLSVFLGSWLLYSFHRLYKIDFIPPEQLAERHLWVVERSRTIKILMSFCVFLLMLLLPEFEAETIIWLIPAAMVSVAYTIPLIPSRSGWSRLRDIPFTKPLIISVVVAYLTYFYPLFEQWGIEVLKEPSYLIYFFERVIFILVVTIPFDLRDVINDDDAGLKTIGTSLGFNTAKRVGLFLIVVWSLQVILIYRSSNYGLNFFVFTALIAALTLIAYMKLNPRWEILSYSLVFEGLLLVYALGYIAISF